MARPSLGLLAASVILVAAGTNPALAAASCFPQRVNFTHSWEADPAAAWHIHSLTPLDPAIVSSGTRSDISRALEGEVIVAALETSVALRHSRLDSLEDEWKEREVGEGIEETLERAWRRGGAFIPTFDPSCTGGDSAQLASLWPSSDLLPAGAAAVPYFLLAHRIHQRFNTLALLEAADITPAEEVTYSLAGIKAALAAVHPAPVITCDNTTSLISISYPLILSAPLSTPSFAPFAPEHAAESTQSCPDDGIFYHPSLLARRPIERGRPSQTQTWDPIYRPSPRPITLSSNPTPSVAQREEQQQPPVKAKKLGVFAGGDKRREQEKERRTNEGQWGKRDRDEL